MDAAQDIKSRLDIADGVQEYLPLKPAGSGSFKGLCPFHLEKTPSFYVNRPRQSWHCFGCDQGGDVISFVMRMEGMEFREALEFLAQKTGVILPAFDVKERSERQRLMEVNDMASRWFRQALLTRPDAEHARAYAADRQIDDLTGDLWRIGYAPNEWTALSDALKREGVTEQELIAAGLSSPRQERQGVYDRFRGRLMFTICDIHGRVVGFTGRILDPVAKEAKYVNTPETSVYKKSHVLYGLDKAKGEMKRQDLAVIVEGNMDVVSSHRAGITNVVASSGTALTSDQLSLIKRFTTHIAIAFDQDAAGNAATLRGLDVARQQDFDIHIITLPPEAGKDPDDAVKKDPELWREAIRQAAGIVEWLYRSSFRTGDASTPEGKKAIAKRLLPEFGRIVDPVERDAWVVRLARDLAVGEDVLRAAMPGSAPRHVSEPRPAPFRSAQPAPSAEEEKPQKAEKSRREMLEERFMALLVCRPELRSLAEESLHGYNPPEAVGPDLLNYLAIFADREFEDQSPEALEKEMRRTARILREEYVAERRRSLEEEMRSAERAGDTDRIAQLLAHFRDLT